MDVQKTSLKIVPIGESQSLKTRAYEALKAAIAEMNIYDDNAVLRLDERDLSARFGISRTPLREALAQLDQEGLVRVVARRGIFIVRRTKAEILDMITVWAALESMAARLAAETVPEESLAELRQLTQPYDDVSRRMGEYSDANIRFHQAILRASGNPLIGDIADGLFLHVRAIRNRTIFEKDRAQRSIVDHRQIVEAIANREPDLAERLVREHTLRLRAHVQQYVDIP